MTTPATWIAIPISDFGMVNTTPSSLGAVAGAAAVLIVKLLPVWVFASNPVGSVKFTGLFFTYAYRFRSSVVPIGSVCKTYQRRRIHPGLVIVPAPTAFSERSVRFSSLFAIKPRANLRTCLNRPSFIPGSSSPADGSNTPDSSPASKCASPSSTANSSLPPLKTTKGCVSSPSSCKPSHMLKPPQLYPWIKLSSHGSNTPDSSPASKCASPSSTANSSLPPLKTTKGCVSSLLCNSFT